MKMFPALPQSICLFYFIFINIEKSSCFIRLVLNSEAPDAGFSTFAHNRLHFQGCIALFFSSLSLIGHKHNVKICSMEKLCCRLEFEVYRIQQSIKSCIVMLAVYSPIFIV